MPVFLVGHVTKEGTIAGPKLLEHMVDAVLYLEGERFHTYRLLRSVKNRFGSTHEVGVFEMHGEGMIEVPNPSVAFLADRTLMSSGSTVVVTVEGTQAAAGGDSGADQLLPISHAQANCQRAGAQQGAAC